MGECVVIPVYVYDPHTSNSWEGEMPTVPRVGEFIRFNHVRYTVTSVTWTPEDEDTPVTVRVASQDA